MHLDVLGQFVTTLRYKQHTSLQPVFCHSWVEEQSNWTPGNCFSFVELVASKQEKRFLWPRDMGEPYRSNMKEGAVTLSIYTPRNVPIPLRDKVKEELHRMEAMGVISEIRDLGVREWLSFSNDQEQSESAWT